MLFLHHKDIIGEGMDRTCYLHPTSNNKCVKITK